MDRSPQYLLDTELDREGTDGAFTIRAYTSNRTDGERHV